MKNDYLRAVKILASILAFYLLSLGIFPCNDAVENKFQQAVSSFVSNAPDSHQGTHTDLCSPLCICSCCQISVDQPQTLPLLVSNSPAVVYDLFSDLELQEVFSHFWQPPKV